LDNLLNTHAEKIMQTAVEMASEVCMSRENYVSMKNEPLTIDNF